MDVTNLSSSVTREGINELPATTGIYIFRSGDELTYIGKSVNLKARLLSHLENAKIDAKEAAIIQNSDRIDCIITDSEFKALLLESQLIQNHKPKYNARWRDDKSPLYIKITLKDEYPKIYSTRKEFDKKSLYFGPFPSVRSVYEILREIRRVFPFCTQKNITKRACFHSKIGLCSPCPNAIEQIQDSRFKIQEKRMYRRNIRNIIKVLDGKTDPVLSGLYTELKDLAKQERFEEALVIRNKIMRFENLLHRKLFSPDTVPTYNASTESTSNLIHLLQEFYPQLTELHRIECFDISNFAQKEATASMVVYTDGLVDKKAYRRFKIRDQKLQSDFEMMDEVLGRRLKRGKDLDSRWPMPNLLIVDGGKPQVRVAMKVLEKYELSVPLIGIAKNPDRLVIADEKLTTIRPSIHQLGFNLVRSLRDESHRFAKKYHVYLRNKKLLK